MINALVDQPNQLEVLLFNETSFAHSHVERKHREKRIAAATYWRTDEESRAWEAEYKRILREAQRRGW